MLYLGVLGAQDLVCSWWAQPIILLGQSGIQAPWVLVADFLRLLTLVVGFDRLYKLFPFTPARNPATFASFSELLVAGTCKVAFDFSEGIVC